MQTIIKNKRLLISVLLVMLSALFILQADTLAPLERYTDMSVTYDDTVGIPVERYIIQNEEQPEEFLIAPNAPAELGLLLVPQSNADILINIEPIYLPKDCSINQIGLSTLQLTDGAQTQQDISITLNHIYDVDLKLTANQGLNVLLDDGQSGRCGKATLTFYKKNNALLFLGIFILAWCALAAILAIANVNPLFAGFGAFINFLFVFANITVQAPSLLTFSTTTLFCIGIIGLVILSASAPIWRWLKVTLITALISLPIGLALIYICYPLLFSNAINEDTIHAVLQSNVRQSIEFWQAFIDLKSTSALIIGFFLLVLMVHLFLKNTGSRIAMFIVGLVFSGIAATVSPSVIKNTPILAMTFQSITGYFDELARFKDLRQERITKLNQIGATSNLDNQTLVVVLGESASKHHMSSYGYGRQTNPNTDRLIKSGEMIRFDAAYSNHVHSNPTISKALTAASNYKNDDWINSPSILNVANAAGTQTAWVSNKPMYGVWDNHMNVIGNEAAKVSFINKRVGTEKYSNEHDAAMLPLVYQEIGKNEISELVFMHLQGSHVHYCARVPDGFDYFKNSPEKHIFGSIFDPGENSNLITRFINCYDNSIRYSDYVLNALIEHLTSQEKPSAVLYISDHGENVMDNKAHNASEFDYYMAEIPAFFWANAQWRDKNQTTWQNLIDNRQKIFTNDHLFEFVTGLAGISSPAVDKRNDLSSQDYVEPDPPISMHGEVLLNASDNWTFWQQKNLRALNNSAQLDKIIAANTNTTTKAGTLINQGLGALEIDLYVQENQGQTHLIVGFGSQRNIELDFEEFIAKLEWAEVSQLWLNIHNLSEDNLQGALAGLAEIDLNTQIKQKAVLIIDDADPQFKLLAEEGFVLSYKLASNNINVLTDSNNLDRQSLLVETRALALAIGASSITLPADSYSQIQQNLDQLIGTNLDLRLSLPSDLDLATPNLSEAISNKDYFKDPRVTAVSLRARSRHDL